MAFSSLRDRADTRSMARSRSVPGLLGLIRGAHLEVLPTPTIVERCAGLPADTTISVTCSPVKGIGATVEVATGLAAQGRSVIPHLAARMLDSPGHLEATVAALVSGGIREVFVIGGDAEKPAGPYGDALALMQGIVNLGDQFVRIGSAAYPDGHAAIGDDVLARSLFDRQALLEGAQVAGWLSTQMCFDVERIERWAQHLRRSGVHLPIHLGVPGAVETTKLLTLGARIGVGASLRYLRKNRTAIRKMVMPGGFDPMELIAPLSMGAADLGFEALHVFTFNQVEATEAWRRDVIDELTAAQIDLHTAPQTADPNATPR